SPILFLNLFFTNVIEENTLSTLAVATGSILLETSQDSSANIVKKSLSRSLIMSLVVSFAQLFFLTPIV
ncbi:hypothetical protein KSS87_022358, partial [Heliosperma pusillum]